MLSRKALLVKGSLMIWLHPRLALDAGKVDLDTALEGVTEENFSSEKKDLLERIRNALRGKIASGASIGDLHQLLNALEGVPAPEDNTRDEPPRFEGRPRSNHSMAERLTAEDRVTRFNGAQDDFLHRHPGAARIGIV